MSLANRTGGVWLGYPMDPQDRQQLRRIEPPEREGCEWSPSRKAPCMADDPHHLEAEATTQITGGRDDLRVCDTCAALPRFNRRRKVPLRRAR